MRRIVGAGLGVALLTLACSGGLKDLGNRFPGPGALARFAGVLSKRPGVLHFYVAVTGTRGDELRIIDPEDDTIVAGPGGIFPLEVPTVASRPTRLAATPLEEDAKAKAEERPGADLLVAVGAGSLRIELLNTWDGLLRVERGVGSSVDLSLDPAVGPGATMTALAAGPVPGVPGRGRVFAALSEGRLAVVEFERTAGGAIQHRSTFVKVLAFGALSALDVRDIAVAPGGGRIFCATGDPIGAKPDPAAPGGPPVPVFGVAQIDVAANAADPAAWIPFPLDALAPTTRVAAAMVAERRWGNPDDFEPTASLKVYAALDGAFCGFRFPINCGLVTLLPGQGLAPDPSDPANPSPSTAPYRAPVPVPGVIESMAVVEPQAVPAVPGERSLVSLTPSQPSPTTAVLVAITSQARLYFVDLGRLGLAAPVSYVEGATRTHAQALGYLIAKDEGDTQTPSAMELIDDAAKRVSPEDVLPTAKAIKTTPGFTLSDTWTATWQGPLPAYGGSGAAESAVVGKEASGGRRWLAFQVRSGLTTVAGPLFWKALVPVGPPELGLRVGDLVDVTPSSSPACAGQTTPVAKGFRTTVAALLPPDPVSWPAGALELADLGCLEPELADGATADAEAVVRAAGLVLSGVAFGYAGRAEFVDFKDASGNIQKIATFDVSWKAETGLTGEELTIVRKARRLEYCASIPCDDLNGECNPVDPTIQPGPVVRFRLRRTGSVDKPIRWGTSVAFRTTAPFNPMTRIPSTGAASPTSALAIDRSVFKGQERRGVHVFAAFANDVVAVIQQGESPIADRVIR